MIFTFRLHIHTSLYIPLHFPTFVHIFFTFLLLSVLVLVNPSVFASLHFIPVLALSDCMHCPRFPCALLPLYIPLYIISASSVSLSSVIVMCLLFSIIHHSVIREQVSLHLTLYVDVITNRSLVLMVYTVRK